MPKRRHTKETIIQTLQNLAASLKKETLSRKELGRVIAASTVDSHFGSLGNALEAAGLQRFSVREHLRTISRKLSDDDLFASILRVEEQLGREPKSLEYLAHREHSMGPFRHRFGSWANTLKCYHKWRAERTTDPVDGVRRNGQEYERPRQEKTLQPAPGPFIGSVTPSQFYGEPIDFRGLRHAPINEQGVVYLFGMVSREIGFYVEAVQQGFPDCEGKYLYDAKKGLWAKARIEFEFRASSFKEHGHDAGQCDFIVCWINDWPECPIRVIELRKEILRLPAR